MYIEKINGPEDVKKLNIEEMAALAVFIYYKDFLPTSIKGGEK